MRLTDQKLTDSLHQPQARPLQGQTIVTEYSDPNPFKVLHAGHFYTSVVGDAISNILQTSGAQVHRVNFGGDVGLHVGKTMWAIVRELGGSIRKNWPIFQRPSVQVDGALLRGRDKRLRR